MAVVWCISSISRVIILFVCIINRKSCTLLFPATQVINLINVILYVGGRNAKVETEVLWFSVIVILIPILLFTTLKYSLFISVATNVIIFLIVRPIYKE